METIKLTPEQAVHLEKFKKRLDTCDQGMMTFSQMKNEINSQLWKFVREEIPETKGWECNYNTVEGTIDLLYKK